MTSEFTNMPILKIDTTDNDYYSQWYAPHTAWPVQTATWKALPDYYNFDVGRMRVELETLRKSYDFKPFQINLEGKKRMTYQGISLTARENSQDPEYDSLRLFGHTDDGKEEELDISQVFHQMDSRRTDVKKAAWLNEKIFNTPTNAYSGYFAEVIDKFKCPKTKVRLLNLRPKGVITPHVDFPYYKQIRIHAAIYTNENSWYEVEGQKFHIPADGRFYWFDVGRNHAVWNDGNEDRITLSVNLTVYEDLNNAPTNQGKDLMQLIDECNL